MIPILIIILFSLALFHWAYESAIAPSWRLGLRYKLFSLRDDLRNFSAETGVQLNYGAIDALEESINSTIQHMREINFGFFLSFNNRYKADESFKKRVDHRFALVNGYEDPEFRLILKRYAYIYREVNVANSGGWVVYLLPLVYVAACWKWLKRLCTVISLVPSTEFPALSRDSSDACAEPA